VRIFPILGEVTYRPKNSKAQHQLKFGDVTVALRFGVVTTFTH